MSELPDLDALLDDALNDFEPFRDTPVVCSAGDGGGGDGGSPAREDSAAAADGDNEDPLVGELAASMEQLMESIGSADDGTLMQKLEEALAELERKAETQTVTRDGTCADGRPSPGSGVHDPNVEHTLRLLSRSAEALSAEPAPQGTDGLGADLLKRLADGLENVADDDEFANAVDEMMSQLLSKDVMLEPLSQLRELFGPWMAVHAAELSEEDRTRYEAQRACLDQIVAVYSSGSEEAQATVMVLMHEMQQHGQPPKELMKDLAPGLELEALMAEGADDGKDLPCSIM